MVVLAPMVWMALSCQPRTCSVRLCLHDNLSCPVWNRAYSSAICGMHRPQKSYSWNLSKPRQMEWPKTPQLAQMAGSARRLPQWEHGARTLIHSITAFGLITLVAGSVPVAETCAGTMNVMSSDPSDRIGLGPVSGVATWRVVSVGSSTELMSWNGDSPL